MFERIHGWRGGHKAILDENHSDLPVPTSFLVFDKFSVSEEVTGRFLNARIESCNHFKCTQKRYCTLGVI